MDKKKCNSIKWTIHLLFLGCLTLTCSLFCVQNSLANPTPSLAFLQKVSSEINKGLPQMLGKDLELRSTFAQIGALGYQYVFINSKAEQVDKDIILANKGKMKNFVCTTPGMNRFVQDGVNIIYSYFGKDGKFITEIVVDVDRCE